MLSFFRCATATHVSIISEKWCHVNHLFLFVVDNFFHTPCQPSTKPGRAGTVCMNRDPITFIYTKGSLEFQGHKIQSRKTMKAIFKGIIIIRYSNIYPVLPKLVDQRSGRPGAKLSTGYSQLIHSRSLGEFYFPQSTMVSCSLVVYQIYFVD